MNAFLGLWTANQLPMFHSDSIECFQRLILPVIQTIGIASSCNCTCVWP